jgi:hypothetical protein
MTQQQLVYLPLSTLTPYPTNPRKNDGAVAAVKASIKEFGWQQPLVVDPHHVIIIGHTRWRAGCELADEQGDRDHTTPVPCLVAAHLTKKQIQALRLVDNKTHELSGWDYRRLQVEIGDLDLSLPALTSAFSSDEFTLILQSEWLPPAVSPALLPHQEVREDTDPPLTEGHTIAVTAQEWAVISIALATFRREQSEAEDWSDGHCLAAIVQI